MSSDISPKKASKTVYISIGNSDDKLTQSQWMYFSHWVDKTVRGYGLIHGAWYSLPNSQYQNACWCLELTGSESQLRALLTGERDRYNQDSIAWAEATTEFL